MCVCVCVCVFVWAQAMLSTHRITSFSACDKEPWAAVRKGRGRQVCTFTVHVAFSHVVPCTWLKHRARSPFLLSPTLSFLRLAWEPNHLQLSGIPRDEGEPSECILRVSMNLLWCQRAKMFFRKHWMTLWHTMMFFFFNLLNYLTWSPLHLPLHR